MTVRQQWGLVFGIVAVLGGALTAAVKLFGSELFPVTVGSEAPDFRAKDLRTGREVSLVKDYRGQVVLLNIWATWCEPCKVEMPSIEALHKAYGRRGLKVVAVSIDDYVTEDSIRSFAKGLGLTFDILHDPSHTIDRSYQTTGWPETFVIAKDGVIRKKWIGPADWNSRINRVLIAELLGFSDEAMAPTPGVGGDTVAPVMLQRPSGEPQRLR
jgi:cytochrome c biogenesis protein CcmG, thiol:disulfide interchange protein DsbE